MNILLIRGDILILVCLYYFTIDFRGSAFNRENTVFITNNECNHFFVHSKICKMYSKALDSLSSTW